MAKACAVEPTGMSAVLGGDEAEVLARLEALELIPANRNAAGQIVAAGAVSRHWRSWPRIRRPRPGCVSSPPPARSTPTYMASALDGYAAAAAEVTPADPTTTLLSNVDGQPVTSGVGRDGETRRAIDPPGALGSVHRDHAQRSNTTAIVEFPPAGALTGIAKRELRGVATHAVKTPADLDGLTDL